MLITAHGGSLGTHRNSKSFFQKIASYNVDVIEVDIWKCGKLLYLSHLPALLPSLKLPLSYAFEFIKEHNFKINCDVKQKELVKHVLELAKKMDVSDKIIFTGSVCPKDLPYLDAGEVYLNKSFFHKSNSKDFDVVDMKKYIDSFGNKRIAGLNLKYIFVTEEFIAECNKNNLPISVFVVDKESEMNRLLKHKELANITTNFPDKLLKKLLIKINK